MKNALGKFFGNHGISYRERSDKVAIKEEPV